MKPIILCCTLMIINSMSIFAQNNNNFKCNSQYSGASVDIYPYQVGNNIKYNFIYSGTQSMDSVYSGNIQKIVLFSFLGGLTCFTSYAVFAKKDRKKMIRPIGLYSLGAIFGAFLGGSKPKNITRFNNTLLGGSLGGAVSIGSFYLAKSAYKSYKDKKNDDDDGELILGICSAMIISIIAPVAGSTIGYLYKNDNDNKNYSFFETQISFTNKLNRKNINANINIISYRR